MTTESEITLVQKITLSDFKTASLHRAHLRIFESGLANAFDLPLVILRGQNPGPCVAVTAAIHGNELNGVRVIQRLIQEIEPQNLSGSIIAVPVLNIPGFLTGKREFHDGADLNRLFPGKPAGTSGQIFTHKILENLLGEATTLIDLHTANTGRENSLYVRADMTNPITAQMAQLQSPQIILHNKGPDGSLRSAAMGQGIFAITVEVGSPHRFQQNLIESSLRGIHNVLANLKMLPLNSDNVLKNSIVCKKSSWLFTDAGGLLEVFPEVAQQVGKGEVVARLSNLFGDTIREYKASSDGVVIGKNVNPVAHTGTRILHLGIIGNP